MWAVSQKPKLIRNVMNWSEVRSFLKKPGAIDYAWTMVFWL